MLYVLYGNDTEKARSKMNALVAGLLAKKPDAAHFALDEETCEASLLEEYISSQGLFSRKYIVVFDHVFLALDAKELVMERVKDLAESDNIFILLEALLDAKTKKKLEKHAAKIQEYPLTKKKAGRAFNIFSITDAFTERNRSKLWVTYRKALMHGAAPEEVHGILFWQVKTLLQVERGSTKGLKPFVVGKAKKALAKFEKDELQRISGELVDVYHRARSGKVDFDLGLEQFLLKGTG